jgi:cyclophilin family peptidyl-prolyl cis-trans isomerase
MRKLLLLSFLSSLVVVGSASAAEPKLDNPRVRMTTTQGVIELELDAKLAPETVRNFMNYVQSGFYNGTIFHRVIKGFMIQGGGMRPGLDEKAKGVAIRNEADNGLKNVTGTIAMARTPDPHSASAQFFINTVDNDFLNHRDKTMQGWGYCVFGKVTKGMEVVKKIESVPTETVTREMVMRMHRAKGSESTASTILGPFENVPTKDVITTKVEVIN